MTGISDNLSWLEHETKINEALSISKDVKQSQDKLKSLAISTISELTSTIKDMKKDMELLRVEVTILRENCKKRLSPEEKEELIVDNLKWFENKLIKDKLECNTIDGINPITQVQREGFISDIQFVSEMISNKVKTIEQGKRIMKLFIHYCVLSGCRIITLKTPGDNSFFTDTLIIPRSKFQWFMFKDYKIIYKILYETFKRQLKRYIISPPGTYHIADSHHLFSNMDDAKNLYFKLVALKEGELYEHDGIRHPTR